jgi:biotin carboxyl carrier protein
MSETIEQPEVETEVHEEQSVQKPKRETRVREPNIRDRDDYLLKLREENEKLRKTLDEQAATRAEEMSNQKLEQLRTETEKKATERAEKLLEKRLGEIEEANRSRLVKAELKAHALRAGVIDFDDVYTILARNLKDVEFDEEGDVVNAGQIITELKAKKPHLFAGISTSSSERAPVTRMERQVDKPALTMSDEEFERSLARLCGA